MPYNTIIYTKDDKKTILEKARKAGLDFRLSCPDGLASHEKGITVQWYGKASHEKYGEVSQIFLSLKDKEPDELEEGHPLRIFLGSLGC